MTSDASDQEPLTPAHLLYGRRITSLPHQEDVPVPHVTTQRVGDVVQIYDESPRTQWKLGTIVELLTGNDGLTRAATLRTSSGLITSRPIVKLYPLEVLLTFSSWPGGCRDDDDRTWREPRRCTQGANVDVTL